MSFWGNTKQQFVEHKNKFSLFVLVSFAVLLFTLLFGDLRSLLIQQNSTAAVESDPVVKLDQTYVFYDQEGNAQNVSWGSLDTSSQIDVNLIITNISTKNIHFTNEKVKYEAVGLDGKVIEQRELPLSKNNEAVLMPNEKVLSVASRIYDPKIFLKGLLEHPVDKFRYEYSYKLKFVDSATVYSQEVVFECRNNLVGVPNIYLRNLPTFFPSCIRIK